MKNKINIYNSLFLCLFIMQLNMSCSHKNYIDKIGAEMKIENGYLVTYSDSNVFVFKSQIYETRDTEKIYPKSFEVSLPRNIKHFQIKNQTNLEFFYDKSQVIYIKIDDTMSIDTSYYSSIKETDNLISFDEYSRNDSSKYILQRIPFIKSRKTFVLRKKNAMILLYNILPSNYYNFLQLSKQFKFTD